MFHLDAVTLRPLEPADLDTLYQWHLDLELEALSGWGPRLSKAAHAKRWSERIMQPADDFIPMAVVAEDRLVGRVDLALIDRVQRRAALGIILGDPAARGRGIGGTAIRVMLDYAFTVEHLERVYAEVYAFNDRARRCFERVGFEPEGCLRGHELHHGARQDLCVYGVLKDEFYRKHPSIFRA